MPAPDELVSFIDQVRDGLLATGEAYPFPISFGVVGIVPLLIVRRLIKQHPGGDRVEPGGQREASMLGR